MGSKRIDVKGLRSVSEALKRPFLRGESVAIRARHAKDGPVDLGRLVKLDTAVEFVTKDGLKYDVVNTNSRGGRLIGPESGLRAGDTLRLGRVMNAGRVFIMAGIVSVDGVTKTSRLARITVTWERFAGDSEDMVSLFLISAMRVPLNGRFHQG